VTSQKKSPFLGFYVTLCAMSDSTCISCRKPKATLECGLCNESVCKKCSQHLSADSFSFLAEVPEELTHSIYCGNCYDETVAPAMDSYEETMERAKSAFVFFKTQRKEIPLIKKEREVFKVAECPDRDETILRLAFFAAQKDCNAVIEVEVLSEKVRDGAYQTSKWRGEGQAAKVDGAKIEAQDLRNEMYR
jgi:hypothetical protein